ncbi:superoxide dismutase [Vermiphilus pyriformis]|jgi:Fe-Mn family superoxide dismutase|uniref:Superoxide dismutase n=1 Tax=candidate division TM6 bacterium JCVI TM6SC1 TaxID=1306947 RepID=A0A0D2JMT2_9BACT|nr:superoxide dismutase [candidate division TM6 bacterium JCVI TM6SC1]UNE35676.1 MAG: superoxide dismutase [Vermiphilus pyriformis]
MEFKLPPLPYHFDALEPYIDSKTMELHYTKHHQTYVDNLNAALKDYPEFQDKNLVQLLTHLDLLPPSIATAVQNNGGGHYNHSLFWKMMKKNSSQEPHSLTSESIDKAFGSFGTFQEQFNAQAKKVFGSGWSWLCVDEQGKLVIIGTQNQNSPIMTGMKPVLGLDVWEHAYYLKYQNRRPDYISAWWHVVNWDFVEDTLREVLL